MADDEEVLVQVKVPVCVTLRMKQSDALGMSRTDLCRVVDGVLEGISIGSADDQPNFVRRDMETVVWFAVGPHWDRLPDDECELTSWEEGMFPIDY